jgi:hypothetical protein
VVDAEHLVLAEHLVDGRVEGLGAGQIGPEGLLHDDPGPVDESGLAEGLHHRGGGDRRDAQIVEPAGRATELGLGLGHGVGQRLRALALGDIAQVLGEDRPVLVRGLAGQAELLARLAGPGLEGHVVQIVERRADDPELRQQADPRQPEQPGQQLSLGQVAGRPEQDDDVRHRRGGELLTGGVQSDRHRPTLPGPGATAVQPAPDAQKAPERTALRGLWRRLR